MKLLIDISEEYYELLQKMPDDEMTGTMYAIKYGEKPCGDAISKQEVVCIIESHIHEIITESGTDKNAHTNRLLKAIAGVVDKMPPVYAEPKTGHWMRVSMDKYVQHAMAFYRCSECDSDIIGTHNYCPNCGCRMESEEQA